MHFEKKIEFLIFTSERFELLLMSFVNVGFKYTDYFIKISSNLM